jgi:hypothetical protein
MLDEMIVTQDGEPTELAKPEDFGRGMAFLNPADMPNLDEAEEGINIQPEYFEFINTGDKLRGVFNGISEITTKDRKTGEYKKIPAVVLQNKDGVKLNAGASLVSQFEKLLPGTAVQVMYKGKEKTKSGNEVKTYEVRLLNVARVNVPVATITAHPQIAAKVEKPAFVNSQRASEYWSMAYGTFRMTEAEGLAHLAEFGNDFSKALDALTSDNTNPF